MRVQGESVYIDQRIFFLSVRISPCLFTRDRLLSLSEAENIVLKLAALDIFKYDSRLLPVKNRVRNMMRAYYHWRLFCDH